MDQPRSKLWIVGDPGVPLAELQRRLADLFHLAPGDPRAGVDLAGGPTAPPHGNPHELPHEPPYEMVLMPRSAAGDGHARRAVDALAHGVALVARDGSTLWANARFVGLSPTMRDRVADAARQAAGALLAELPAGGAAPPPHPIHIDLVGPDGGAFEVLLTRALADPAPAIAVVVRDVTAERRLRAKLDAIDQAGSSIVSFPTDAVRKVNAVERLRLLETRIVQACRELLSFDHFLIRVLDERTGRLEMIMHSGLPQEAVELEIRPGLEGNGISGLVAATGQSYICRDTQEDQRFLPGFRNARSSLTVPLRLHDRVIGVFNVESDRVAAFSDDDRQFAEIFSRYVAIALHMLNLLVVERSATSETFSGRVEGELSAPLQDILKEADWLRELASRDPEAAAHVQRIVEDVESIRNRVRNVASGAQTLLGVEGALREVAADPVLQGKTILVADDEANVRRIIHDVLHNRGAIVATFPSGAEAILALDQAAAGARPRFDVVLSDIRMPDRNGYEVFAAARRALPGVPVILMTGFGYDPHHSIVRASQEGLQNVLFKPFPVERLVEELRKAIATPR